MFFTRWAAVNENAAYLIVNKHEPLETIRRYAQRRGHRSPIEPESHRSRDAMSRNPPHLRIQFPNNRIAG